MSSVPSMRARRQLWLQPPLSCSFEGISLHNFDCLSNPLLALEPYMWNTNINEIP